MGLERHGSLDAVFGRWVIQNQSLIQKGGFNLLEQRVSRKEMRSYSPCILQEPDRERHFTPFMWSERQSQYSVHFVTDLYFAKAIRAALVFDEMLGP